jgi:hypothetical protein
VSAPATDLWILLLVDRLCLHPASGGLLRPSIGRAGHRLHAAERVWLLLLLECVGRNVLLAVCDGSALLRSGHSDAQVQQEQQQQQPAHRGRTADRTHGGGGGGEEGEEREGRGEKGEEEGDGT